MLTHRPITRFLLLASIGVVTAPLALADSDIYRSRDDQGRVIFTDKPSDASEAVKLPQTNTMEEVAPAVGAPAPEAGEEAEFAGYQLLAITSPADGETVFIPVGELIVGVSINPPLQAGHSLNLLLDGAPSGTSQDGAIRLEGVSRGTHTLQLQVVGADGEIVHSSSTVTVHTQRATRRRIVPLPAGPTAP